MRTILRNFLTTLKRFKMASILNILGLSVAFAAFIVILMQIDYELGFDKFHPKADRIYRLEHEGFSDEDLYPTIAISRRDADEWFTSSPHIEAGAMIRSYVSPMYFSVEQQGQKVGFKELFLPCSPGIAQVFDFHMVEGDTSALRDPEKLLIPQSMATKLFGDRPALGQLLHMQDKTTWAKNPTMIVGGVYRDFPHNSQLPNEIYRLLDDYDIGATGCNYTVYLLLDSPKHKDVVLENYRTNYIKPDTYHFEHYQLTLLSDAYYSKATGNQLGHNGDRNTTRILLLLAILIICIAAINFTNFSTAMAPVRIKGINTRRVLGSRAGYIRILLIGEAIGINLIAFACALLIVKIAGTTPLTQLLATELSIGAHIPLVLFALGVAIVIGTIAGAYPAFYMTSFSPALVLKGSFGLSPRGRRLRTGLIAIQFIVSIALIISAIFIRLQNRYMQHFELGFDKDQIAVVQLSRDLYLSNRQAYAEQVRQFAGIEDVAFADWTLCSGKSFTKDGVHYQDQTVLVTLFQVSDNFLRVLGIPITAGRDFTPADPLKEGTLTYIFNQTAQKQYNLEPGKNLRRYSDKAELAGIMGDIQMTSLHQPIGPAAFCIVGPNVRFWRNALTASYIKVKAGVSPLAAAEHIRKTIRTIDPMYPVEISFLDQIADQQYRKEVNLGRLITLFCLLAVLISLMGVFGLVVFDTQYRRKEIALRKVFGATIGEILVMFNRSYLKVVGVCFLLAVPAAYYGISRWLENFSQKTPMYLWVYVAALLVILLVTTLTVTLQSYRAATENPAKAIKSE